eukprot:TRINITY_DN90832_c0_g1_i1.p1 TRINITY_DN90832_c0_g1~~TRINITY_DN90832_c0_g1_i1.p1  ORF type:complete len:199 (+),score=33.67 TRINITY_DN90832_c0_g1_i1:53-598(+)
MGAVATAEEDRHRPEVDAGLVTACCMARKGKFRHGPDLPRAPVRCECPMGQEDIDSEDELFSRYRQKVRWQRGRFIETRLEVEEEGEEWAKARRTSDVDLSALPERPPGEARKMQTMSYSLDSAANTEEKSARARRTAKKGRQTSSPTVDAPAKAMLTEDPGEDFGGNALGAPAPAEEAAV